ncbi:hypothetical protein ACFWIA_31325 [Streptomyces sp. NPDC127068]|uniref:hypothetical protein n=1 Tax=Streptomyces sp. NPDC127068 TaxID=3347127 RepID=UPI00365FDAC0
MRITTCRAEDLHPLEEALPSSSAVSYHLQRYARLGYRPAVFLVKELGPHDHDRP